VTAGFKELDHSKVTNWVHRAFWASSVLLSQQNLFWSPGGAVPSEDRGHRFDKTRHRFGRT